MQVTIHQPVHEPICRAITDALYGGASFGPASLFTTQNGVFYDISDISTLFQDTSASSPVTTAGQSVLRVNDLSGNSNYAIQATGASAPLYGIDTDGTPYIDTATARALYTAAALDLSSSDKLSVLVWLSSSTSAATAVAIELSASAASANGCFYVARENATTSGPGFLIRGNSTFAYKHNGGDGSAAFNGLYSCLFDIGASGVANEVTPYINGATRAFVEVGADSGGGNFASAQTLNIGSRDAASSRTLPLNSKIYAVLVIQGILTAGNLQSLMDWGNARYGLTALAAIGDSTAAAYSGTNSIASYVTKAQPTNVAVAGHTIAQQKTAWEALSASVRASHNCVIIQTGLNDLDPAESASVAIARLQDLVDTVLGDVSASCKVFASKMIPCRSRLIALYGGTNGPIAYQKWLDMNEAIAGSGATPITGVYGRITAHEPLMNDGSGNLLGAYDTGDGIHPDNAGRQVNATAWRDALVSASLLKAI